MTESDNNRRQLSQKQFNAIDLLILGLLDADVAEKVGVSRQTVNQWRNQDSLFVALLNYRRQEIWNSQVDKLRRLISKAIDVLAEELESEDKKQRHSAAVIILKAVGFNGTSLYPEGETSPKYVEAQWESQEQKKFFETLCLHYQDSKVE
jgi:hypothetical protein